jgi:aerobic carbon-monoxide dehydrogenase small subunit
MPHSAPARQPDAPSTELVPITVRVNGIERRASVEARTLFVNFLRETLGLTGTHVGCDTSQCGACAVLLDGVAVKACTLFAVQADGASVTTIEGLSADGALHPIQQAFWDTHALQCGFCTPGMVIAVYDLLSRIPNPSEEQIRHGLEGNYCRCTGYHNIVKAVQVAARAMAAGTAPAGSPGTAPGTTGASLTSQSE